jgi:hypothetical protein
MLKIVLNKRPRLQLWTNSPVPCSCCIWIKLWCLSLRLCLRRECEVCKIKFCSLCVGPNEILLRFEECQSLGIRGVSVDNSTYVLNKQKKSEINWTCNTCRLDQRITFDLMKQIEDKKCVLKINKKLSPNFNSEVVVHQNVKLSSNLFILYLCTLPTHFKILKT